MKAITIIILVLLVLAGCKTNQPIGGDKDAHGCLIGAGYSWCPSTGKCQRMWETYCAEFAAQYRGNETAAACTVDQPCTTVTKETCTAARGHWNECGSKCAIDNQGKEGIMCAQVCDAICECGGIAGFGCPEGFSCYLPQGIVDALGYCG